MTLKPVVMLGNNGLTEGVLAEIEQALGHHELIKVKIASEDRETKALIVEAIVRETGACNDKYVQQAQKKGLRSRAWFKLDEIQQSDKIFKPGMTVVDLGAAPGGWSQYAVTQIGNSGRGSLAIYGRWR